MFSFWASWIPCYNCWVRDVFTFVFTFYLKNSGWALALQRSGAPAVQDLPSRAWKTGVRWLSTHCGYSSVIAAAIKDGDLLRAHDHMVEKSPSSAGIIFSRLITHWVIYEELVHRSRWILILAIINWGFDLQHTQDKMAFMTCIIKL